MHDSNCPPPQDDMLRHAMDSLTRQVVEGLTRNLTQAMETELSRSLSQAMVESEFYRRISTDMRSGLQEIYQEIAKATRPDQKPAAMEHDQGADQLFMEASKQLDEILTTTENATVEIMDVVEKHMMKQHQARELLELIRQGGAHPAVLEKLITTSDELAADLIKIMESLSFQDLTGQRIKRIIAALKKIESTTFDLYVSTSLSIKAREEAPTKDLETIAQEAKAKASQLKGPQMDSDQAGIDDMLKQLGL